MIAFFMHNALTVLSSLEVEDNLVIGVFCNKKSISYSLSSRFKNEFLPNDLSEYSTFLITVLTLTVVSGHN